MVKKKRVRLEPETPEELEAMGQDSETKAAKWVIEKGKAVEEQDKEDEAFLLDKLDSLKHQVYTYNTFLMDAVKWKLLDLDFPTGFYLNAQFTDKGLCLYIRTPDGKWYARGIKVSQIPKYDLNGIDRLIVKSLNFMDAWVEKHKKPSPHDLKR